MNGRGARVVLAFLGLVLSGWIVVFVASGSVQRGPSPKHLGGDYSLFLAGAHVLEAGHNPYDQKVLYRSYAAMLRRDGTAPPKYDAFMRVGSPPLFLWALRPLAGRPFTATAIIWCMAMYALLAVGCLWALAALGWRHRAIPLLGFLAFPQTVYAAFYGNVDGFVVAGLGAGLLLAGRRPFLAGSVLPVAFLKPQVGLPAAGLIVLFLSGQRTMAALGFGMGSAVALGATFLTTGASSTGWWLQALTGYSQRLGVQPDIASLSGLYVYAASDRLRVGLELISLAAASLATAVYYVKKLDRPRGDLWIACLWIGWFLATPFAHFHDEVVLLIPMIVMLGRDGWAVGRASVSIALFVLLLSIVLFPTARAHTDFQSLSLVAVLVCAVVSARSHGSASEPRDGGSMRTPSGIDDGRLTHTTSLG